MQQEFGARAEQLVLEKQLGAFTVVLVWPAGHAVHMRLLVAVPAWLTNEPGWQLAHAVHEAAFAVLLNVLLAQAEQVRSAVALPAFETN